MKNAVIIFMKNPVPGKVKTRLAADIGPERALQVYRKLLQLTRQAVEPVHATRYIYYSDVIENNDQWPESLFEKRVQKQTPDLGERMLAAFEEVFANHEKVLIIGSDCPDLTSAIIEKSFDGLDTHDAVLGPAKDGGYYLLGLKKVEKTLFEGKEWSTSSVLMNTQRDMEHLHMTCFLLPELADVDTAYDLRMSNLPLP